MDDSNVTKVAPNGDRIDTTTPTRVPTIGATKQFATGETPEPYVPPST